MSDELPPVVMADIVNWKQIVLRRLGRCDDDARLALSCILAAMMRIDGERAQLRREVESLKYGQRETVPGSTSWTVAK